MNISAPLPSSADVKLPTVPDGFEVVIHRHRHPEAPADGVAWHVRKKPKSVWDAVLNTVFGSGATVHVTRVRGGLDLFEQDMQEQVDAYFAERNARELAWKIRTGR